MIDPKALPKLPGQCCGNCKWFAFGGTLTNHNPPRFRVPSGGECIWPMPSWILPLSITRAHGFQRAYSRSYVWVKDDTCPTWEPGDTVEGTL